MNLRVLLAVGVLCLGPGSAWAGEISASSIRVQFDLSTANTSIPGVYQAAEAHASTIHGSYADVNQDTASVFANGTATGTSPAVDGTIYFGVLSSSSRARNVGTNGVVPEPGSILLALGAASLLALRRR
jgi:hypothetical protein